jgi:glycosyltransferase involved in cell wall biosynthesis
VIALFSRSIYPRRSGSADITEQLAKSFSRDELFIVGGRKAFTTPMPRSDSDVEVFTLGSELNVKGRGDRFFRFFRWCMFPLLLRRSVAICRARRCTSVIGTFPDEFFVMLALRTARNLGLPFFAYFHNTLVENRTGVRLRTATYVQRRVFEEAEKVFVISKGMERYYQQRYPGVTFVTVPHTFTAYPSPMQPHLPSTRSPKTVVLVGNFNQSNIDATCRVVDALGRSQDFRIVMYTPVPRVLLKVRGVDVDKVSNVEYIPGAELVERMKQADLLVLTHGFHGGLADIEYRTIFPTRTIPLLLAEIPLLVHAPAHSFVAEFFREHGCGVLVDEADEEKLVAAARALTSDGALAQRVVARAREVSRMFYGPEVKKSLQLALHESAAAA